MECIPENDLLEFPGDVLQSIREEFGLNKPGDMDRAIDILEEWIKQQNHFEKKDFPRSYLEKAIIANKGSIERTKQRMDKICTFRTIMPQFFGENLTKNEFSDLDDMKSVLLPKQTDKLHRVYLLKNFGQHFTPALLMNYYRYFVLVCEYIMAHDYNNGLMIFIDYTETNLMDLIKSLNLLDLRQIITIMMDGFGMRLKGIHLLTSSKAVEMLVTMLKQMLSEKIGNRVYVHKDIDTLYNYIPKDVLPVEYGGKEKSLHTLSDNLRDTFASKDFMDYIEKMNEAKTNESCRQPDKFYEEYAGLAGTFRTLSVD